MTSRSLRILVIDDEPLARRRIVKLLGRHGDVRLVGEASNGAEAVAAVESARPDVIFLDVQMPDLDGFGVLETIAEDHMPVVVFVTAYDAHALQAFEVAAVDYLLKPFDDERFGRALARARGRVQGGDLDALRAELAGLLEEVRKPPGGGGRLAVHSGQGIRFVEISRVDWVEAEDNYVRVHADDGVHLMRDTLRSLEQRLVGNRFARVHRSAVVNLDRVREVIPDSHSEFWLRLAGGAKVKVSRTYAEGVRKRLSLPST